MKQLWITSMGEIQGDQWVEATTNTQEFKVWATNTFNGNKVSALYKWLHYYKHNNMFYAADENHIFIWSTEEVWGFFILLQESIEDRSQSYILYHRDWNKEWNRITTIKHNYENVFVQNIEIFWELLLFIYQINWSDAKFYSAYNRQWEKIEPNWNKLYSNKIKKDWNFLIFIDTKWDIKSIYNKKWKSFKSDSPYDQDQNMYKVLVNWELVIYKKKHYKQSWWEIESIHNDQWMELRPDDKNSFKDDYYFEGEVKTRFDQSSVDQYPLRIWKSLLFRQENKNDENMSYIVYSKEWKKIKTIAPDKDYKFWWEEHKVWEFIAIEQTKVQEQSTLWIVYNDQWDKIGTIMELNEKYFTTVDGTERPINELPKIIGSKSPLEQKQNTTSNDLANTINQ